MKSSKLIYILNDLLTDQKIPYYLRHFISLSLEVFQRYPNLFQFYEIKTYECFFSLPINSISLYIRLFSRKGSWFKIDSVAYSEIELETAIFGLKNSGFLVMNKPGKSNVHELYSVLTKQDIQKIIDSSNSRQKKQDLWDQLIASFSKHKKNIPVLINLMNEEIFQKLMIIFFGNPYQDLSTFVVEELEHLQHFPVELSSHKIWKKYEQFNEYTEFYNWETELRSLVEQNEISKANRKVMLKIREMSGFQHPASFIKSYYLKRTAHYRMLKFLLRYTTLYYRNYPSSYGRFLKHLSSFSWPIDLAYDHFSLQIIAAKKKNEKKKVVYWLDKLQRELKPYSFQEQVLIDKTKSWLAHKRRPIIQVKTEQIFLTFSNHTGNRPHFLVNGKILTAEEAVIQHLVEKGWQAIHSENFFLRLAGILLFIKEIFLPQKGQFQSQFQDGPLDYRTKIFFTNRISDIKKRISTYQNKPELIKKTILLNFSKYQNYALPGLYLKNLDKDTLEEILQVIPPFVLLNLATRYIYHPGLHGRGFPDLIAFNSKTGEYAFIEVKSPGDKISEAQRYWLDYMQTHKITCRVINIRIN